MSSSIHRERVFRTLRGERVDRRPCGEFFISADFVRMFLSSNPAAAIQFPHYRAVVEQLDLDIVSVAFSTGWGALEQPDEDQAIESVMQWQSAGDRFVFALIDGPFSAGARRRGFNTLLHYVRGAPHAARELFRQGGEESRVIAQAARDAGADGVILGEDIAYNRSTYLSPDDLRTLYLPELRAAVEAMHALGLRVFFHSDGTLDAILSDLAKIGLDGIQGLEPEAGMNVRTARERVGPAFTLWGNLSFEFLSKPRTDAEIANAIGDLVTASSGEGIVAKGESDRLILGSCAGLVQGMDANTVRRVYRAITNLL